MKRMTSTLTKSFVCKLCVYTKGKIVEPSEKISIFNQVDFVKNLCYLGDRLNASGGSEAAVTARTRIGWIKFRKCGELLYGRKFSLKMKRKILLELPKISNAVWELEMAILRRTKKAIMREMCGVKMIEKRRSQELMS